MPAQIYAATQRGIQFSVEVCPCPVGGACRCADRASAHLALTFYGPKPDGETLAAWQRRHAREALRIVDAAASPPVAEPVRALAGLTLAG